MISRSFVQELLDRADVYEVINRRVPLQMKGVNGWACCPFHNEKTSSFSVNREKQFWHCFGCGEHGNALSFLMKYEHLDFPSAVEKLAQETGMQVRYEQGHRKADPTKPKLTDLMQKACDFYQAQFRTSEIAQKYVSQRGLTAETIEKFEIGFAPDGWHNLDTVFASLDKKMLIQAGLQREGQGGNIYDFFRNRLMFPIKNVRGQVIAFSARTMIGEEPKYINTGETPIFTKGSEVFGLHEALPAIHEKKRVIVVEGQMDVIQLSQAGFKESCAPLGTAIKTEHVEKLLKLTDHIVFSFDGDNAGRKAARRAMELSLPLLKDSQKASFLFLPEGEDPDSFVKSKGAQVFEEQIQKAIPLSSFLIEALTNGEFPSALEDRTNFIARATPLLRKVRSPLLRAALIERLATASGLGDAEQLAVQLGFRLPQTVRPIVKPYSKSWGYRYENKELANNTLFRTRAPDADLPNITVLRNLLHFPQLIVEFEQAAMEFFSSQPGQWSTMATELFNLIFQEDAQGVSLADLIKALPARAESNFEKEEQKIRDLIETSLIEHPLSAEFSELSRGARSLNMSFIPSRLETQRIFLIYEINQIEIKRRALVQKANMDDQVRQEFSRLLQRSSILRKELQELSKVVYKAVEEGK